MATCIRISESTGLALHTMTLLSESPDAMVSNQQIAEMLDVSAHHLAKVHQRLVKAGLLKAVRGPNGGFRLGRSAETITLIEVVEAVDGPFRADQCLLGRPVCRRIGCPLGAFSSSINQQVVDYYTTTTVDQLKG
jgi:Rrf2 family protein